MTPLAKNKEMECGMLEKDPQTMNRIHIICIYKFFDLFCYESMVDIGIVGGTCFQYYSSRRLSYERRGGFIKHFFQGASD